MQAVAKWDSSGRSVTALHATETSHHTGALESETRRAGSIPARLHKKGV